MDLEQGVQLGDIKGILKRRWGLAASVAGAVLLAAIFVVSVLPAQYEASSMLMIEPQTISRRLIEAGLEESDVNNRLHLMTAELLSRGRLSRIIDDLELYRGESEEMTREEVIWLMRQDLRVEPVFPELQQEASNRMRELEISTFRIFFRSEIPRTAAAVANRLANDFVDKHIQERVRQSGDTTEFIEAERERLSARIAEVENRVAAVKAENPGRLPENLLSNQRLLERMVESVRGAEREQAIAESDEAFYRQQVLSLPENELASSSTPPVQKRELLELQLSEFRSRGYTDKHPDVIAVEQEIATLVGVGAAEAEAASADPTASLVRQSAIAEQRRAALRAAASREEIARLKQQIAVIEERIVDTPRVAEQLGALEREYSHLFESYQQVSAKRQEAAVAADMERRQKGEQFRLLEAAVPPAEPIWPNRLMLGGLGMFLAMVLGAGAAALAEATDSSFHGSRGLQKDLRVPVLASIPAIRLQADRRASRRRRVRRGVAWAALATLVLAGSVAGNWWVNGMPGGVRNLIDGEASSAPAAPATAEPQS